MCEVERKAPEKNTKRISNKENPTNPEENELFTMQPIAYFNGLVKG
jgi:hypothetical protein